VDRFVGKGLGSALACAGVVVVGGSAFVGALGASGVPDGVDNAVLR
jgi:hypothetical protein